MYNNVGISDTGQSCRGDVFDLPCRDLRLHSVQTILNLAQGGLFIYSYGQLMAPWKLSQQKHNGANYQVLGDSGAEGMRRRVGKVPYPLQKIEMFID